MSLLQKLSQAKSASLEVKSNNENGATLSVSRTKSASLDANVKNTEGFTLSTSQPQNGVSINKLNGGGLSVSAVLEPQPYAPSTVILDNLANGNGVTVTASTEQPMIAFPTSEITTRSDSSALSTSVEEQISAVNLSSKDELTLSAPAAQPIYTTSANVNGNVFTAPTVVEPPRDTFLGVGDDVSVSTGHTCSFVGQRTRTVSGLGNRPVTPTPLDARRVIQKEAWLEEARRSTEQVNTYGSPVPFVWVVAQGNRVPANAVPFGEDNQGYTLYIARALVEGGLYIGKVSTQHLGAVITYAGKEHTIHNYEVLAFASQTRWGFSPETSQGAFTQGTVVVAQQQCECRDGVDWRFTSLIDSDVPRIIGTQGEQARQQAYDTTLRSGEDLERLAEVKTVILIDDSLSMQEGNLWAQAREALGGIVDIANQYGSSGADIYFMHLDDYEPNVQSKSQVDALFSQILPSGEDTPTGARLGKIIQRYVPLIEYEHTSHAPIVVVVITNSLPTDHAELNQVIVDVASRLDHSQVKQDMFRIQFVQIGTDTGASALLHTLDADLVNQYKIRDIVDYTPYDPAQGAFDTAYMLKIMLGRLRRDLDRIGPRGVGSPAGLVPPTGSLAYERSLPRGLTARLGNASPQPVSPRPYTVY